MKFELPGEWPNGAVIYVIGDHVTIRVVGIDSVRDLEKIIRTACETGATKGTLFTGPVVDAGEIRRYLDLIRRGQTRFGGRVAQIGPDQFRLDFDELPSF